MTTYRQLYAILCANQSAAIDLLSEGRVFEAIALLKEGLLTAEDAYISAESDIFPDR